ncbi:hypothetical protein ACIG56_15965 [Nocardia fusca]|uniref:hypothetical protein n=1 Tax=Nocardia fusca TaxID=941183 RepID=UPI0037CB0B4E
MFAEQAAELVTVEEIAARAGVAVGSISTTSAPNRDCTRPPSNERSLSTARTAPTPPSATRSNSSTRPRRNISSSIWPIRSTSACSRSRPRPADTPPERIWRNGWPNR